MISREYVHVMARYNRWQNKSLYGAASDLDDRARRLDRGAFFGSIHGTLNHLLWGDTIWMSRFSDWTPPEVKGSQSATWVEDWDDLVARRRDADAGIITWADGLDDGELDGDLVWYSGVLRREVQKSKAYCVAQFFNHQTHHRGQVHAMLTGAGAKPDDTDLFIMPDDE